jgi:hypothetical protein
MRILGVVALAAALACAGCGKDSGDGDAPAGPVGQWVIDKADLRVKVTDMLKAKMGGGEPPAAEVQKLVDGVAVTVDIQPGGTWTAKGTAQGDPVSDEGTWKLDGGMLTIQWAKRDSKPDDHLQVVKFEGDAFEVTPEPGMPFAMRMVRKK